MFDTTLVRQLLLALLPKSWAVQPVLVGKLSFFSVFFLLIKLFIDYLDYINVWQCPKTNTTRKPQRVNDAQITPTMPKITLTMPNYNKQQPSTPKKPQHHNAQKPTQPENPNDAQKNLINAQKNPINAQLQRMTAQQSQNPNTTRNQFQTTRPDLIGTWFFFFRVFWH